MKKIKIFAAALFLSVLSTASALDNVSESAITNIIHEYVDSWNHHHGRGFANNFSDESHFVNIFGMHFHGREAIQQRHDQIHDTFLNQSTFTITDLELSEVNPTLVLGFVRWRVDGFHRPGQSTDTPGQTIQGIFSHVFVKNGDRWEIASTQNTMCK